MVQTVTNSYMTTSSRVLELDNVVKVYGGTIALRGVSMAVQVGEIHGLVGENGAGKSTLVRIVTGVEEGDSGSVSFPGGDAGRDSCAVIHQSLALIEDLSVAENIALGIGYARRVGLIDWKATRRVAVDALEQLGVPLQADVLVSELSVAQRAIVAIARAVAQDVRLLILDEPTASLQADEVKTLFSLMRRLRERNVACLLISHRIDEVLAACDRLTVMRDGGIVGTYCSVDLTRQGLIRLILGQEAAVATAGAGSSGGDPVLTVDGLAGHGLGPLSFDVRSGEIVAFSGRGGAGHLGVAELLFGMRDITAGTVQLRGEDYRPKAPADAIDAGVAYVPADRQTEGIAGELTARENIFMNPSRGLISRRRERAMVQGLLKKFDVRPPEPERELSTFSGGNQQKVVLAKWLRRAPKLLILAEPTAAVDVGAKLDIYNMLRRACAEQGTAVILASSDFEEVALLADRALILSSGKTSHVLEPGDLTTEAVTQAAFS